MEQKHFLTRIFTEQQFTNAELDTILGRFEKVTFARNQFLLSEGKTAKHYWFVENGFLRSFAVNTEGKDITTNFYTAGDIVIDWPSFFMRTPARENFQALTDCTCWQLDFDSFQELFHSIEAFREQGRSRLVYSYFALKNHNTSMISDHAKDRYKRLLEEKPQIFQNVSLKQIATYLGITDTSLSRIRRELMSE